MKGHLDFDAINAAALTVFPAVLRRLLPNGKTVGREFLALNPRRADRSLGSFKINRYTGKWCDFSTGDRGGDPTSLVAYLCAISQAEAARLLAQMVGVDVEGAIMDEASDKFAPLSDDDCMATRSAENSVRDECELVSPIPNDAPTPPKGIGRIIATYEYRDAEGRPTHYVRRLEPKVFHPQTLWRNASGTLEWQWKHHPTPRPLYGLESLSLEPNSPVFFTEGEKKADACRLIFPDYAAVAICGGSEAVTSADLTPLAGRDVIVWPDNDAPGRKMAVALVSILLGMDCKLSVIAADRLSATEPSGETREPVAKWDAADAIKEWSDLDALRGAVETCVGKSVGGEEVSHARAADEKEIARLAVLDHISYDREREQAAKRLGCRVSSLDKTVEARRVETASENAVEICREIEPWAKPINVAELLNDIRSTIARFIVCETWTATAAALWIAFTWIIDDAHVAPMVVITAPEKRCGKSQLLEVIGRLSKRGLFASSISPAATFRVIEAKSPTLLIDEADAFFRENEELRGIINSGHTRASAYVIRCFGDDHDVKQFSTWCAKAIAGIGKLADTVVDRSIVLSLRRKLAHEKVERLRHAEPGLFETLARKLARFGQDYGASLGRTRPDLPDALNDRAQDNWEHLLAIADLAGAHWPKEARGAALELSGEKPDAKSTAEQLLSDIRAIFDADGGDRIASAKLVKRLIEDDSAPWLTWSQGKPMTTHQLGRKLSGFSIKAHTIHLGPCDKPKGYRREQFDDAWERYLGGSSPNAPVPPVTGSPSNGTGTLEVTFAVADENDFGHLAS